MMHTDAMKKILIVSGISLAAILACGLIAALLVVNSWRATPYGKLSYITALMVRVNNSENPEPKFLAPPQQRILVEKNTKRVAGPSAAVQEVRDISIPLEGRHVKARIYKDDDRADLPVLVYFHGGGWVVCSVDGYDYLARLLCRETGALVISVDYRLAPENPFPAGVEDCYGCALWVSRNARSLGGDPGKLMVCGDSAGGNLAAVVARMAAEKKEPEIACQILIYPVLDLSRMDTPSYAHFADGFILTRKEMEYYRDLYLSDPADRSSPLVSPLLADVPAGLAPALMVAAQFDVLHDEGRAYRDKLEAAGVRVKYVEFKGVLHSFVAMTGLIPQSHQAIGWIAEGIRDVF